ncbi:MAG: sulfatase [Planctomycetes bacterium SCN 63-9]|nr:MAG: sulfatase [Planctomycetes bacterium SCN 63-9]
MNNEKRLPHPGISRRALLQRAANGFGTIALSALLGEYSGARAGAVAEAVKSPHFPARAKNVIFLFMEGAVSQVDSFDYKPMLARHHGKNPRQTIGKLEKTQFENIGTVMKSPWAFHQRGESGLWVSELFPCIARQADEICVIKSMTSAFPEHTSANYFLHSGLGLQGRPSMGAWIAYGLGSFNQNLPAFVVLNGGQIPSGGLDCFGSGFLPAAHQGSLLNALGTPLANIVPGEKTPDRQIVKRRLVERLNRISLDASGGSDPLEAAIANAELASRMQVAIPELLDLSRETRATKTLYGLDAPFPHTQTYGRQCLIARRMVERGVRFIELTIPMVDGYARWDAHGGLISNHGTNALAVDQPIAALLVDLKQRGLLDSTLVVWAGEFGRTPFAQGSDGRDHNEFGFSVWMAGGGVRPGMAYGATDEWGYRAIEKPLEMHDLHATILHLLGLDHTKLTYRFGGRDIRLTDVHGNVVHDILA